MSIMLLVQIGLFGKTRRKHFLCLPIRPDSQTRFFDRGNYGLGKISGGNRKIRSPWKAKSRQQRKANCSASNFCLQLVSSKGNSNAISEIFLPDNARDLLARCDTFLPPVGLHHHDCPDANRNFQISQLSTSTAQLGIKVLQTFGKFKMEEPRKISFQGKYRENGSVAKWANCNNF